MSDYEKAMLHVELALRRTSDSMRRTGNVHGADALWAVAEEISTLAEEARSALPIPPWKGERMAERIQRKRIPGWRMPPNTVSVCRPGRWGNPWPVGKFGPMDRFAIDAEGAVGLFRMMLADPEMRVAAGYPDDLSPLVGKNLACWCRLDQPCHATALLELANAPAHPHPAEDTGGAK